MIKENNLHLIEFLKSCTVDLTHVIIYLIIIIKNIKIFRTYFFGTNNNVLII